MIYNSYQIAEIIGVNVSTVKRWTDSGKLQCQQTIGGHRKFHLHHITDFLKNNKKTSSNVNVAKLIGKNNTLSNAIDQRRYKYLVKYSYEKLISGSMDKFILLNNSLILKGYDIHCIFDEILIPTLKQIGDNWIDGKITITEEHLASEIIRKFLSNLNFQYLSKKSKYNAFCFTLIDDKHDLPIHMGESILNQCNTIKTFNLGPNLPVEDFVELSKKVNPDIVFVSIIYIQDLQLVNQQVDLLCKTFKDLNTSIFFRGIGLEKISCKYSNYEEINTFQDFHSFIAKKFT